MTEYERGYADAMAKVQKVLTDRLPERINVGYRTPEMHGRVEEIRNIRRDLGLRPVSPDRSTKHTHG